MTTTRRRQALLALYAGLALTVLATAAPFVDHVTDDRLADHIRAGYPNYSQAEIDTATTTWLVILTAVGIFGIAGWLGTIWTVRAGKPWAPWAVGAMFVVGTSVALTALFVRDTSGDTGLPPLLGWIGTAPSLAGLAAVIVLCAPPLLDHLRTR
jgi:hypothetical protein